MFGLSVTELLVLLAAGVVLVSVVRTLLPAFRPSGSTRFPDVALTADQQSRLRSLASAGHEAQAVGELRAATGLARRDARRAVRAIAAGHALPVPAGPARGDLPPPGSRPGRRRQA